jgi:Cof subfamily protein (haloacid dehalogenase superfamily)
MLRAREIDMSGAVRRKRFYVSDLDGTLLDDRARLSPFARAALSRLLAAGVAFTVATARSAPAVRAILGTLPIPLPIIEQNGACVTDLGTGRHLSVSDLPLPLGQEILGQFRRFGVDPIAACIVDGADRLLFENPSNAGTSWYIDEKRRNLDPRLRQVAEVELDSNTRLLSLTTLVREGVGRTLAGALAELGDEIQLRFGHHVYVPGFWELSVLGAGATKSAAIAALRQELGLRDAELVVFGDAENDIDMFRYADTAIAVENAAPELLAIATRVVASNVADGVVRWLLEEHSGAEMQY